MRFKDFVSWCGDRACDGMWGMNTALACIEVIRYVHGMPFWKREKVWKQYNNDLKIEEIFVNTTNAEIEAALSKRGGEK